MAWATEALAALDGAGYRRGGARAAVVDLLDRQNCCLSAQEIHARLRRARRPVGIASVYRERVGDDRIETLCEHVRRWLLDGRKPG